VCSSDCFCAFDEARRNRHWDVLWAAHYQLLLLTRLTHTDPKAETAALPVAEAGTWSVRQEKPVAQWLTHLPGLWRNEEWLAV
jgi:hypothetical protein